MILAVLLFSVHIIYVLAGYTPEDLKRFAVQHQNAEQFFNEFTLNWSPSRDDVVRNRAKQLTRLGGSPYYTEVDDSTDLKTGTSRSTLTKLIDLFGVSQPFENILYQALTEGCPMYLDEEFSLEGKTLTYHRIGFMQQYEGLDKYMIFRAVYSVDFTDLLKDTQSFLECAAQFSANESVCPQSKSLSISDWQDYKTWARANAITSFMANSQRKRNQVIEQLRELVASLPLTYMPVKKCSRDFVRRHCGPKLDLVLGLAKSLNFTKPTLTDEVKAQLLIKGDVELLTEPFLKCQVLTGFGVQEIFTSWLARGFINQVFSSDLASSTNSIADGGYFVNDLFFESANGNKTVIFARVYAYKDKMEKSFYDIGGVFVKVESIGDLIQNGTWRIWLDTDSHYSLNDQVYFVEEDTLLKNYITHKAVNFLTPTPNFQSVDTVTDSSLLSTPEGPVPGTV